MSQLIYSCQCSPASLVAEVIYEAATGGTSPGAALKDYTFFSYETNEALHLSEKEKQTLYDIVQKIDLELSENIDRHSQNLIVSNIELLLNYCIRYYDRQFITRKAAVSDVLSNVDRVLGQYFQSVDIKEKGLPTVKYLADQVNLSPNYLSDFLKREPGMKAKDRIHYFLIEEAKALLLNTNKTEGNWHSIWDLTIRSTFRECLNQKPE